MHEQPDSSHKFRVLAIDSIESTHLSLSSQTTLRNARDEGVLVVGSEV